MLASLSWSHVLYKLYIIRRDLYNIRVTILQSAVLYCLCLKRINVERRNANDNGIELMAAAGLQKKLETEK
jgi:hypothetical protein